MSDLTRIKAEVVAIDAEAAAKHLRKLADMIEQSPSSSGWTTSDIEGNAIADPIAADDSVE